MPWKVAEVDIAEEEATVNWSQDQSSALYKVDELAKFIADDDDENGIPTTLTTAVSATAFAIAINNEVHIFDGEHFNFLSTLSLDSEVCVMAWSPDSQFLVIGDSSGILHFFSFVCEDVIFSTRLIETPDEKRETRQVFCNCSFTTNTNDTVNLIILATDGNIFTYNGLRLKELSNALESKNLESIDRLKKSIEMKQFSVSECHDHVSYCTSLTYYSVPSIAVAGGGGDGDDGRSAISIWSDGIMDTIDCEIFGTDAKKCQTSPDGNYLIVLDECKNLTIWDTHSMVMLSILCCDVKDFIITCSSSAGETDLGNLNSGQVVVLIENHSGSTQLEIYELPALKGTYSMILPLGCLLAESSSYQDKVFYIDFDNTCNNNNVPDIIFKCLSESSPEHRLYRLVRKKRYTDALEFSKAFRLDTEFVYKAKASTILAEISSKISESDEYIEERTKSVDQLIEELQESLENVKDVEFCIDCCVKASPPTLHQVYKLLCFAKTKVCNIPGGTHQKEMLNVLNSIQRLETFKMVFGESYFTVSKWRQFCAGNMLTHLTHFLSEGQMSSAAIIWKRYENELEQQTFKTDNLQKVLASIRSDLHSSRVILWLEQYLIPSLLQRCQNNKDNLFLLASWLEQRVKALEISEKNAWPENGLRMAKILFDVNAKFTEDNNNYENISTPSLVDQIYGCAVIQVYKHSSESNAISNLALLLDHITELQKLYSNYHCKIPLAEFSKESRLGIMFKMLDSVLAIELIPRVVSGQITQYGIHHGFQIDNVLLDYISDQIKQTSVSQLSNTLREARLVEITNCIKTRSLRFEAIIQLMSWATVPWSIVIEEMVQKAMGEDPSNQKLKWSYRLMELKKILSIYGLRGIEFSNDSHVKGVVEYILNASNTTALEDALQIADTYHCLPVEEAYSVRLQTLCRKGMLSECTKAVKMVPDDKVTAVVEDFLIWVTIVLQEDPVDSDDVQTRVNILKCAIAVLEHFRDKQRIGLSAEKQLYDLKNILCLQTEYSILISPMDYNDSEVREDVALNHIKNNSVSMKDGCDKNFNMSRLAKLLSISKAKLQSAMLKYNNPETFFSDNAVIFEQQWLNCTRHELTSEELFSLCRIAFYHNHENLVKFVENDAQKVLEFFHMLLCCALINGQGCDLHKYINFCKLSSLNMHFVAQCESGGFNLSTSICEEDTLQSWNTLNLFKDNGFVLDATVAVPLQCAVLSECMQAFSQHPSNFESMIIACRNLVCYLEENNLHELGLQYALYCLGHLVQYTAALPQAVSSDENQPSSDKEVQNGDILLKGMASHGSEHISSMLLALCSKILQSSHIDQQLAIGYLCSIAEDTILKKLKNDFAAGQRHSPCKVITVFTVSLYYATNFCCSTTITAVEELYSVALWYSKLTALQISCGSLLTGEKRAQKVLECLLEKPGIEIEMIIEFCKSFSIEIDEVMYSYIWNLSNEKFSCSNTTKFEHNFTCAINHIVNNANLFALLKRILESLSPYDYERLVVVLNEIIKRSDDDEGTQFGRQIEVLKILAKYKRLVLPCDYERSYKCSESTTTIGNKQEWCSEHSDERLPFHPLVFGNPWKIISPELNDETTTNLLPLCRLLKLQEDQVYISAVNNIVSSCLLDQQSSLEKQPPNCQFEKAAKLLSQVKNPEIAVKTAVALLSKWPQSDEKVRAAKATVDLASKWISSSEGGALDMAEKIYKIAKENAQEIVIEHILLTGGVTEEKFLKLKHKPAKLLMALYSVYGTALGGANIHKMASEIALVANLNINKVHSHLMELWLHTTYSGSIRSSEYSMSENKKNDCENMKRVVYLLEDTSLQNKYALFLLNFAYRSGQSINYKSRVRAMQVLFNVTTYEVIENLANDSLEGIKNYMKRLFYLSELEYLHLPQTMESFQRCNKEGLVKGLWKNHKDNVNAILLIADICLDFDIRDSQVWSNILRQLLHLGASKYLGRLLPLLTKFTNLWHASNLLKVWRELSVQPVQKFLNPLSPEDKYLCQKSMLLLQRCPIMIGQEEIVKIIEKLLDVGMPTSALACCSLLPAGKRTHYLQQLFSVYNFVTVLDAIDEDEASGYMFVSTNVVKTLVYEQVVHSMAYLYFKDSNHLPKLADFLIGEKKFHKMVIEIIKTGDHDFAEELARYYEVHGSPLKKSGSQKKYQSTHLNDLLCYLENIGVLQAVLPYLPAFENVDIPEEKPSLMQSSDSTLHSDEVQQEVDIFDVF